MWRYCPLCAARCTINLDLLLLLHLQAHNCWTSTSLTTNSKNETRQKIMNKMLAAMVELNQKVLKSKLSVRHFLYSLHISYRGDEVENPGYIMNMYWLPTIPNFQHYLNIVEPIVRINMWMHVNVCVTYFLLEFVPKIIKKYNNNFVLFWEKVEDWPKEGNEC